MGPDSATGGNGNDLQTFGGMVATTTRTDRQLLLEIALILALLVLSVVFYLRPAADETTNFEWWNWVVLSALFFGAVGLHTHRRRRRAHSALHEAIREDARASDGIQD